MNNTDTAEPTEENCPKGPLPVVYTAEELGDRFTSLLAGMDFSAEIQELGIGRLSVLRRAEGKTQFTALCVGLWKLALYRSFPDNAEDFFQYFLEQGRIFTGRGHKYARLRELAVFYTELLEHKRESDFSDVAEYMLQVLKVSDDAVHGARLKLALLIRRLYSLIFTNLI